MAERQQLLRYSARPVTPPSNSDLQHSHTLTLHITKLTLSLQRVKTLLILALKLKKFSREATYYFKLMIEIIKIHFILVDLYKLIYLFIVISILYLSIYAVSLI